MDENLNLPPEQPARPAFTPPPRRVIPMQRSELVLAVTTLLFSMLLCSGLLFHGFNLGFALGACGTLLCAAVYLVRCDHRPDRYTAALLALSLLIAAACARTDDAVLKFLAGCVLLPVSSLALCLLSNQNLRSAGGITSILDGWRTFFEIGCGQCGAAANGIADACSASGVVGKRGSSVALGLVIALPLLAVVVPLLMFADAAFEGLLDLLPEIRWNEVFGTLLFGGGLGYLLYTRTAALHHLPKAAKKARTRKGLNAITVNTVLVSVSAVYVVYLFSQLAYFVGGFSGILPADYTLASYARRGFFEMAWLCAINLGLIALSVALVSARETPQRGTRLLCLFLGLITLFLVSTASAKMLLYIGSYGLTRLRVLTEVFMLWLALSTVVVCIWLFRPQMTYMKPILLAALAFFAALLWFDVDTQVARYNVRAYQSGRLETVDVAHLDSLSDGAVPYLYELTFDTDPPVAEMARDCLRYRLMAEDDLRGWNYASACAQQYLHPMGAENAGEVN